MSFMAVVFPVCLIDGGGKSLIYERFYTIDRGYN